MELPLTLADKRVKSLGMSWLTDFTSKAETFLNKIDQSAAVKFNESETSLESPSHTNNAEIFIPISISPKISPHTTPVNPIENSKPCSKNINSSLITKSHSADGNSERSGTNKVQSSKKQDEMLFAFLNNTNSKAKTNIPKALTSLGTSPATPLDSRSNSPSVEVNMEPDDHTENALTSIKVEDPVSVKTKQTEVQNTEVELTRQRDDRISHLELENQLLKNEMQSLNIELSGTLSQLKEKHEETEKYKMRYENRRNQQNEDYERIRSEYENKENDLQESLKAKDSQLAVLRVRIQEVDGELKEKVKTLIDVQNHNEELMKDHTDASGIQNVALDSLREKLEETENQLYKEQRENEGIKSELMSMQQKLYNEQNQYAETIKQFERKQHQGKETLREFEVKVKQVEGDTVSAQKELKDYKEKAARILQAKEKLITSLKQGNVTELPPMLFTELEEVKHERDMICEEYTQYKCQTEQLKSDYQELELLHNTDSEDNQQKFESLQSSLHDETTRRKDLEEDMKRYLQELQFNKEELHKIRKSQVAQNQLYEEDIRKLQNQVSMKQNISSSQEELENRIRTLTDSLIHKQTVVETLSTEKNSLVLQLERLEKQYYDIEKSLDSRNKERNNSDISDLDRGGRLQSMYSILPSQILHNRHWKTTANEIDKFSVRLGVFLRRYPAARLMVFIYMLILHIWVTFVLLTYTPEIHDKNAP